jgi:hypothetical protein
MLLVFSNITKSSSAKDDSLMEAPCRLLGVVMVDLLEWKVVDQAKNSNTAAIINYFEYRYD